MNLSFDVDMQDDSPRFISAAEIDDENEQLMKAIQLSL